jgi:signal transduction histidine kinase
MSGQSSALRDLVHILELSNTQLLVIRMPEAIIHDATTAVIRKWNCQRGDVIGKPLLKFGTGAISARYIGDRSAATSGPQPVEVCFASPLGTRISSHFRQHNWQDEQGIRYALMVGEQASGEDAERAISNEKRLNLALRSGGYALWDYDFETRETYNSPEMYDLMGFPRGSGDLNFESFNLRIHPDDQDKTLEHKLLNTPFGADVIQSRYRVRMADNEFIWIESVAGVIRDPVTGKPVRCVGLCRNVNDQMATLERLRASERTMKRTQQAARLGSFSINNETGVSRMSSEMAVLIGMGDAIVHPALSTFIAMIEPGAREKFEAALELAKKGTRVSDLEIAVRLASGDIEYFQVIMEPEADAFGKIDGVFGSCQLVTERKALERRFHQAQKMEAVGQLTGGVAHDFNNLLMVVMGNLQLVDQLVAGNDKAQKRIRSAMEAAEKGSELTRRMLAFSRQNTLQNKEIDVNRLVGGFTDMVRHATGSDVVLTVLPGDNVWPVKADQNMLESAILNLSINARDAMLPRGGKLIIETRNVCLDDEYANSNDDVTAGEYVEIAVTDTGCGIAPENLEKVFQPFFTTKGPESGSGLGLSMIYGFVKQSGGHVKIYSEVGHGTTVKMYLPRLLTTSTDGSAQAPAPTAARHKQVQASVAHYAAAEYAQVPEFTATPLHPPVAAEPAPAAETMASPPAPSVTAAISAVPAALPASATGARPVVLVVEDNMSVREVAAAMIEEMGYEVLTASNGVEGYTCITERPDICLMLSDVIMAGGLNGPELAAKAIQIRPDLKVLFMSGYAPGSVRQMQDLPASIELVNKPFTRNDLTEKVKKALAA